MGRRLGRSGLSLTIDAALDALADSGLDRADIDGLSTWPGSSGPAPGFTGAGVWDVKDALGLNLEWFLGGSETAGQLGAVVNAVAAIRAGLATHVLCFRTVWESTAQTAARRASIIGSGGGRIEGSHQWMVPFGAASAANWAALLATRHFREYGTTREQVAGLATTLRANAGFESQSGAEGFDEHRRLPERAHDLRATLLVRLRHPGRRLHSSDRIRRRGSRESRRATRSYRGDGNSLHGRPYWDQYADLTSMAAHDAAEALWRNTALTASDVDIAQLYDGFSILTLIWLEALGLCGKGESGPFVAGGTRIAHTGELPLNTGGGQLSAGRLHGFGHLHEACVQLRGLGGSRQVPNDPEVAVVAAGGGYLGGALLLTRHR